MDKHKKHADGKSPIDDLFARKLSHASLPPSADSFERLQARMGQRRGEPRMVVWRNPNVQRFIAAAACLLLVCLFGWLYLSGDQEGGMDSPQVADKKFAPSASPIDRPTVPTSPLTTNVAQNNKTDNITAEHPVSQLPTADQLATAGKTKRLADKLDPISNRSDKLARRAPKAPVEIPTEDMVAQIKPVEPKTDNVVTPKAPSSETPATPERAVNQQVMPAPVAERVLVVTIAEPERLVAARQTAKTAVNEPTAAVLEKPQKETKSHGFWEQVRRVKQGEVFARRDAADDERGLIGRAYSGLKHSIDKDKDAKQ